MRLGVIPSVFAWVIASSGTWGSLWLWISYYSWWLPPPRWLGAAEELWHEFVIVRGHLPVIVRGLVPSPAESRKITLVDCSCHWVTSLVGRFLWRQVLARCVIPISCRTTKCRHKGDVACQQAREPQEKYCVSLVSWTSPGDWFGIHWLVHLSCYCGIISLHTHMYLLCLLSCLVKLFSVVSLWELVSLVSEAL